MPTHRSLFTALTLVLLSAPAFAQDNKPAPAPGANSHMTAPKPSTTGAATTPVVAKTNLTSITAIRLEVLPDDSHLIEAFIAEATISA